MDPPNCAVPSFPMPAINSFGTADIWIYLVLTIAIHTFIAPESKERILSQRISYRDMHSCNPPFNES